MKKKQLLVNNYHTHTFRCGHAHGEDEEYVKAAIKYGYKELGFSDHIFYHNLPQPGIRQNESDYEDYVASITFLKNKYKDKLKILIGYESEYQPSFHDFYLNLLKEGKIEYLILGNHCFIDNSGHYIWYNSFCNDKQHLNMYITNTIEGMKSGLFSYVAHPDIILNSYDMEDLYVTNKILELCKASVKYNCPLEINLAGAKSHIQYGCTLRQCDDVYYPYAKFWKIVGEIKAPVIVGVDAHMPDELINHHYEVALDFISRFNLRVVDTITVKKYS